MELPVKIVRRATNELLDGVVRSAVPNDKLLWSHWFPGMSEHWEDSQWDWDELIDLAIALPDWFEVYSLEALGELQGLRMLALKGDLVDDYGVHALRLATAPWNRHPSKEYYGVGSVLVGLAIQRSLDLGFEGRCYCESLPRAMSFHERNGMVPLESTSPEGLARYHFTADAAVSFLNKLKADGLM